MESSTQWDVLESPTVRCMNFRSAPLVQSRNRRDAPARMGSVETIVAARGRNTNATVGAPAMATVAMDTDVGR